MSSLKVSEKVDTAGRGLFCLLIKCDAHIFNIDVNVIKKFPSSANEYGSNQV